MAVVSASSMLEFVRRVFRELPDYGKLTIRRLRNQYIKELKVPSLSSENREVFASIVSTVYKEFENGDHADIEEIGFPFDGSAVYDTGFKTDSTSLKGLPAVSNQNGATGSTCNSGPLKEISRQISPTNSSSDAVFNNLSSTSNNVSNTQYSESSDSDPGDDDEVIRAVKETLGVIPRKRPKERPSAPVPLPPPPPPAALVPPPASVPESTNVLPESKEPSQLLPEKVEDSGPVLEPKKSSHKEKRKKESKTKKKKVRHHSVDDMPLFTLRLTKTSSGEWAMMKPKSEESDAGDNEPSSKPRKKKIPEKRVKRPLSDDDIFSSSDDEPLSKIVEVKSRTLNSNNSTAVCVNMEDVNVRTTNSNNNNNNNNENSSDSLKVESTNDGQMVRTDRELISLDPVNNKQKFRPKDRKLRDC